MTHTPGPWRLDPDGMGLVLDRDGSPIQTSGPYCVVGDGQAYANARLIAAAPELLAALKEAAETARNYYMLFHDETWNTRLRTWEAAIDKAEET